MRRILLLFMASPSVPHFTTYSHKLHDFYSLKIKCVFWFSLQLFPETCLILRRIQRDIINVHTSSYKVPVIIAGFQWYLNFTDRFSKNTEISYLIKIRPVEAELFPVDGQTDMTKLIVAFRSSANASNKPTEITTICPSNTSCIYINI